MNNPFDFEHLFPSKEIMQNKRALEKALARLRKKQEQEYAKIKARYDAEEAQLIISTNEENKHLNEDYLKKAGSLILEQLEKEYGVLQKRNTLLELADASEAELNFVNQIIDFRSSETRGIEELLLTIKEIIGNEKMEKINRLVRVLEDQGSLQNERIFSYLGVGERDCVLLTPVKSSCQTKSAGLVKNLEDKLISIIDTGEIIFGLNQRFVKGGEVSGEAINVRFMSDLEEVQGFVSYFLTPNYSVTHFADALKSKLEELQPDNFKQANLQHVVHIGDINIVSCLIKYEKQDFVSYTAESVINEYKDAGVKEISISEAAKILGIKPNSVQAQIKRGNLIRENPGKITLESIEFYLAQKKQPKSRKQVRVFQRTLAQKVWEDLNYSASDEAGKLEEAKKRLEEYREDVLSTMQATYVLGKTKPSIVRHYIRQGVLLRGLDKQGVTKESLLEFLKLYRPAVRSWQKKDK